MASLSVPFDSARLDRLLDDAGIEVLFATSKHNIQYMLGGHRAFFFDYMDAFGTSRYLPVLVYPKGAPEKAAYVGHGMESYQHQNDAFWTPTSMFNAASSIDAMEKAAAHVKKLGLHPKKVGVESAFVPLDASAALHKAFPSAEIVDALFPLERLRAVKTQHELDLLRVASERVTDAMMSVFASAEPGMTTGDLAEALRREEVNRGLTFEYCLVTAGTSVNRAPSKQKLAKGDIMSLDSGGNYQGYIGDLCRMGILGAEPDAELEDLLGQIEVIQRAGMKPMKHGVLGKEVHLEGEGALRKSSIHNCTHFVAHGMGLISHEAPRLTDRGPVKYTAYDAGRPLEAGMVISVETTMQHPRRGFIKLEDTVIVTKDGYEMYGEQGRGWNRAGA